MDLIYIAKQGEPVLKIHPDALDQHKRLGWQEASAELVTKTDKEEKKQAAERAAAEKAAADKADADKKAAEKAETDRLEALAKAGGAAK